MVSVGRHEFISKRACVVEHWEDFLGKYLNMCNSDEYHPANNLEGYINLGTAVNNICNDILYPKITSPEIWSCDTSLLQYKEGYGILRLRKALASFMTEFLGTSEPVKADNLFCVAGVTACIDLLAHCLADPGEYIMTPTPVYCRIYTDMLQRSLVNMWPIPVITENCCEDEPQLTLQKVKEAYFKSMENGKVIRGLLLINPNNPLGTVYNPKLVYEILDFCKNEEIHVIVDEVYALSIFSGAPDFHSVLKFPKLPDPERTHVLYGISKDLCLAGLRIGVIHTLCKPLQRCLRELTFFQVIPFPVMNIASRLLEDTDWCKEFIITNKQRLTSRNEFCRYELKKMGLKSIQSSAAFFIWTDFREVCEIKTFNEEREFFIFLIEESRLYIVPGKELFCDQSGWFRISFTGNPDHVNAGLQRLAAAIEKFRKLKLEKCKKN